MSPSQSPCDLSSDAPYSVLREDGTPLNDILVTIKDWCKNHFEVVHQLRINTDNSHPLPSSIS